MTNHLLHLQIGREGSHGRHFPLHKPAINGSLSTTVATSFISHALAGGRTLAEVRDAVGHANSSITSAYLHVAVEDDAIGSLFG